jgi:hypothetical protein
MTVWVVFSVKQPWSLRKGYPLPFREPNPENVILAKAGIYLERQDFEGSQGNWNDQLTSKS